MYEYQRNINKLYNRYYRRCLKIAINAQNTYHESGLTSKWKLSLWGPWNLPLLNFSPPQWQSKRKKWSQLPSHRWPATRRQPSPVFTAFVWNHNVKTENGPVIRYIKSPILQIDSVFSMSTTFNRPRYYPPFPEREIFDESYKLRKMIILYFTKNTNNIQ